MSEITKDKAFKEALIGRTIVAAHMDDDEQAYEPWNYQGGDIELTLDNGAIVKTFSSGYDAWSNEVQIEQDPNTP